jgi:tryptophan synthase alpha subunit
MLLCWCFGADLTVVGFGVKSKKSSGGIPEWSRCRVVGCTVVKLIVSPTKKKLLNSPWFPVFAQIAASFN